MTEQDKWREAAMIQGMDEETADLYADRMNDGNPEAIYAALVHGAEKVAASRAELASVIVRAYDAGWETGDIYEALNEGGYGVGFAAIEGMAQRAATQ